MISGAHEPDTQRGSAIVCAALRGSAIVQTAIYGLGAIALQHPSAVHVEKGAFMLIIGFVGKFGQFCRPCFRASVGVQWRGVIKRGKPFCCDRCRNLVRFEDDQPRAAAA